MYRRILMPIDGSLCGGAALAMGLSWPATRIEGTRWEVDLIVMGTHGRHAVEHPLLGSVAEGVVRTATIPVLLLRAS